MSADNRVSTKVVGKSVAAPKPQSKVPVVKPGARQSKGIEVSGQEAIGARNEFYQDGAAFLKKTVVAGLICLAGSIGVAFYSAHKKENNVYFAGKEDGTLVKLIALDQPNMSQAAVTNWVAKALVDTFDFSFNNVERRLNDATMRWFTPSGGSELIKALKAGGNLDSVQAKELFVNLTLSSSPLLIDSASKNGEEYAWKYEVPAQITYRTRTKTYVDNVVFNLTVQRQSMISNADGLGIAKIIMIVRR